MYDVSLVKCGEYDFARVKEAMKEVLLPIGGLDWIEPGMKIVIKANLVAGISPGKAATTHPAVLSALTELVCEKGASVVIGDSPGGLYNKTYVNRIYSVTGMHEAENHGAVLNQDFSQKTVDNPGGKVLKSFTYTAYLDDADGIIDFCKLKSHGMMGMSNAAKNMFGAIPGTIKPEYHYKFPDYDNFADMIVDIDEYFKPRLSIADAITGMEGNGPTAGTPRFMGFLAASFSPHKLDLVCAEILGMSPETVPTLSAAIRRGLIPEKASELNLNADISEFAVESFKYPTAKKGLDFSGGGNNPFMKAVSALLGKALRSIPKVSKNECVACGVCAKVCPAKAITIENKKLTIDRDKCIRCFCCQEFCPKGAMKVHRPVVARIADKL